MLSMDEARNYWQYCLSIESTLEKTVGFAEVCDDNDNTYSFEYAKVIMLACSEIDVVCRLLCKEINPQSDFDDPNTNTGNIKLYADLILNRFPSITSFELSIIPKRYSVIAPFDGWELKPSYSSPKWWGEYQKIKHYRHEKYQFANQNNAFYSVAGLITLNLYLHRMVAKQAVFPTPNPRLFNSDVFLPVLYASLGKDLVGFQDSLSISTIA